MFGNSDKKLWREARTLTEVGELTALWLEGRISHHPGYGGGGPDLETRDIARHLAAACRAGYVTSQSQPGTDDRQQRAAVEGFATPDTALRLQQAARRAGLEVVVHTSAPRWKCGHSDLIDVIDYGNGRRGQFGVNLSRGVVAAQADTPEAVEALLACHQVTIVDRVWGRNTVLWRTLSDFSRGQRAA